MVMENLEVTTFYTADVAHLPHGVYLLHEVIMKKSRTYMNAVKDTQDTLTHARSALGARVNKARQKSTRVLQNGEQAVFSNGSANHSIIALKLSTFLHLNVN